DPRQKPENEIETALRSDVYERPFPMPLPWFGHAGQYLHVAKGDAVVFDVPNNNRNTGERGHRAHDPEAPAKKQMPMFPGEQQEERDRWNEYDHVEFCEDAKPHDRSARRPAPRFAAQDCPMP